MPAFIHCDRCGLQCPCYPGQRFEYFNCGPCEEDYQISLWRGNFCSERGWAEWAEEEWDELFLEEYGYTYEEHKQKHAEYTN